MKPLELNPWDHPQSYIRIEPNEHGKLVASGTLMHHGAEFRFCVTQQSTGGAAMRGSISVISPVDGRIMQVGGKEKTKIIEHMKAERPEYLDKMAGKRLPELNASAAVSLHSLESEKIKETVERAMVKLYAKHAGQIHRKLGDIARPETISPSVAAHKFVDAYLAKNHASLSEKGTTAYRNAILCACAKLPYIPMAKYKHSMLQSYFEEGKVSKTVQTLLRKFWQYCLDAKICSGTLPFPPILKPSIDVDKAVLKAIRPDTLTLEEEDAFYELIMSDPNGPDCGCALQLWGGYSTKAACAFTWGDVIWGDDHDDYVRMKYSLPDLTGATHDYTAPLFPAGALILRKRYGNLLATHSKDALSKMPIVSLVSNPKRAMKPDALVQHTTMRLHSAGITYAMFEAMRKGHPKIAASRLLLLNTYAHNVNVCCSLQDEPGTAKFLLHESLSGYVTDDHYTCFTDDESGEHLHTIMSCLIPADYIEVDDEPTLLPSGKAQYIFTPETTRHRAGHIGTYALLPDEEIVIFCPHGVMGSVSVRAIEADGSKRRKSRSKKE